MIASALAILLAVGTPLFGPALPGPPCNAFSADAADFDGDGREKFAASPATRAPGGSRGGAA